MDGRTNRLSTMRLYGAAIAIVSGVYSIYLSTTGPAMNAAEWGMMVLGVVVVVHGVVLLTAGARTLGDASGPLMIGYAVLMLANQAWMAWRSPDGMDGMMNGMMNETVGMGADAGMVAIATVMLASGVIMTVRREMTSS